MTDLTLAQEVYGHVAKKSADWQPRMMVVSMLIDKKILTGMAEKDSVSYIREAAVKRLAELKKCNIWFIPALAGCPQNAPMRNDFTGSGIQLTTNFVYGTLLLRMALSRSFS
ncbi:MAG: hypothetical protein FWF47_01845, partial [Clostridia bacterium]|nr:hypothetical protein [Clostridia bacterium]